MTQLAEQVELEAAIAEAELTDEEAELVKQLVADESMPVADAVSAALAEREQPPAPEPPPPDEPPSGEPTPKQLKALENELVRHERRVHEVMGPFAAGMEPCQECGGVGLTPPGPKPREHAWFHACETCDGFGQVKTGSLNPEHALRACPGCAGRGYVEAIADDGTPLASRQTVPGAPAMPPAAVVELAPAAVENGDAGKPRFGVPSWMGDPSLGR